VQIWLCQDSLPTASSRGSSRYKLALCFRFQRLPGYCHVQLFMLDFSLAPSEQCAKDYLLLGGKWRYCGESLHSTGSKWEQDVFGTAREGPWWADMQVWHNTPTSKSRLRACYVTRNKIKHNVMGAARAASLGGYEKCLQVFGMKIWRKVATWKT